MTTELTITSSSRKWKRRASSSPFLFPHPFKICLFARDIIDVLLRHKHKHYRTMYMSTHLPMYVFTSQIPTIVISQAGIEPLTVRLMDGQKTLLETTLYPLAGQIKLYDIGRIYEEYLRSRNNEDYYPYIIMELEVGGTTWEDNMIIYCPHH